EAPEQWHFPYYDEEMAAAVSGQLDEADILLLHPVVLGHGERLFAGSGPTPLRLVHSATFATGVLHLIHHPGP
ncbi:hypothetical protein ABZ815_42765, partial [Nonomuraea sp. NPDC047529]